MADFQTAEFHANVLSFEPKWAEYPATQSYAHHLNMIHTNESALKKKAILAGEPAVLKSFLNSFSLPDEKAVQWSLAMVYDMLREDSSCYNLFEDVLKENFGFFKLMMGVLRREPNNGFIADKSAWLLSAVMGNVPRAFSDAEVKEFLGALGGACSDLGTLDAIVNVLKAEPFRKVVIASGKFTDLNFSAQTSLPAILYKHIFALWMFSYEPEGSLPFKEELVIQKLKDALTYSRVEKVVRLSLTCLRNLLSHKAIAEQVVELGLLEVVQQLEFEKWRDAELYDDIRDMSASIQTRMQEMSNFSRYERELQEGKLKWGFIHSSKFWAENVLKFEENDWRALKTLAALLHSDDATTLAVACHDLGEFVTMHPLGKKQIAGLGVKNRVMDLMSTVAPTHKEVRREALLCCQKIMLNKWQDVEGVLA